MSAFGITTFPTDYGMPINELAAAVEQRALDSIFFNEHSHMPVSRKSIFPGGGDPPRQYFHTLDPFVALSIAAAATRRITLGTGICLVAQRDPIQLAKEVASLDFISGGRVVLGIGGGWNAEEMANHGAPFAHRWNLVREKVLAMRAIWTNETAEFHGEFVNFDPIWSWPKPVQRKGPKILLGSRSSKSLERVAEYCDGWLPLGKPGLEISLSRSLGELRSICERRGRGFDSIEAAVIGLGPEYDTAAHLLDAGFRHLIFSVPSAGSEVMLPKLDEYASLAQRLRQN